MESFKKYLREVNPHNIQSQIAVLKKQSTSWSEDDLAQIIDCILERVSVEPPDMGCLYLYTCRMMAKFEGKVKTSRHHASVTFQDVLQKRVNHQLGKRLEAKKRKSQENSKDGWKHWRELDSFCSFLGRLFVHDVLASDTLLSCIRELVKHDTETSWLLISKTLKDLMFHLESRRISHNFDPVFQKIYEMIQENHLPVGTSFVLCDLCDVRAKYQEQVEAQFHTLDKIRGESSWQEKNNNVLKVPMNGVSGRSDSEGSIPQQHHQSAVARSELVKKREETESENRSSRLVNCNVNKVKLKYIYKDDQWSPINPQGRKKYDRDFLLTIRPECTLKPKGLPDIPDVVLEKAEVRRSISFNSRALKDDGSSDETNNLTSLMHAEVRRSISFNSRALKDDGSSDETNNLTSLMHIPMNGVSGRSESEGSIPQQHHQSAVARSELVKKREETESENRSSRLVNCNVNKVKLKYIYEDDQWSPINPQGRKKYDRDFLLTIRPECTLKPKGLPDIPDVVLEKAEVRRRIPFNSRALKDDGSSDETNNLTSLMHVPMNGVSGRSESEGSIPQQHHQSAVLRSELVKKREETESENRSSRLVNCNINKVKLKYIYKDDQWSPINPQGRKKYDRNFLLTIQPECTIRPKGLPDIPDIVLGKAHVQCRLSFESCAVKGDGSSDKTMNLTSLIKGETKVVSSAKVEVPPAAAVTEKKTSSSQNSVKNDLPVTENHRNGGEPSRGLKSHQQLQKGRHDSQKLDRQLDTAEGKYTNVTTIAGNLQTQNQLLYVRDQFSLGRSLNGKMKHDRKFLLSFQSSCKMKPEGLPNIIIDERGVTVHRENMKVGRNLNGVNHLDSSRTLPSPGKKDQMKTHPSLADYSLISGQKNGLKKCRSLEVGSQQTHSLNDFRNHPCAMNGLDDTGRERAVLPNGTNSTPIVAKAHQYQTLHTGGASDLKESKENSTSPAAEPSEDEHRKIFETIIKEYLTLRNVQEVIRRFEKLPSSRFNDVFICLLLERVHEGHPSSREVAGRLFHALLASQLLSEEHFNSGFELFIGSSDESSWSELSYWKNLADILAVMVVTGTESLGFMREVIQTVPGEGNSVCLVAETLKQIQNLKSVYQVLRLWRNSNFTWSLFAPEDFDIHSFVEKERLAFTLPLEERKKAARPKPEVTSQPVAVAKKPKETLQPSPILQPQQNTKVKSIASFQNGLLKLLQTQQMIPHRVVFDYIESSVPDEAKNTEEFIETLVLAVLMSTVVEGDSGPYSKCHRELFKRRAILMKRYLKEKSIQMHAIQTAQAFAASVSHPPGLLRTVFEVLYDEDVVSEEIFYSWLEDEETCQMSKLSVSNFFKWLQES